MSRTDKILILALLRLCSGDVFVPEGGRIDSNDIAFEFGQVGWRCHGFAKIRMFVTIDSQHTDHKWHLGGRKIFAYVPYEMGQQFRVKIVLDRLVGAWISRPIDEVVETLKPNKARQFKASFLVIFRTDPLGICQHRFHMIDHHSVEHTRGGILVVLPFFPILSLGDPVSALGMLVPEFLDRFGERVSPSTWRTEFGVE